MRVNQILLDDDGKTYIIGGTKFRYRAEQDLQFELGQEVELVELICKTRPYLVMSAETNGAYDVIKDRTGKTVNGVFVKEEDLHE